MVLLLIEVAAFLGLMFLLYVVHFKFGVPTYFD